MRWWRCEELRGRQNITAAVEASRIVPDLPGEGTGALNPRALDPPPPPPTAANCALNSFVETANGPQVTATPRHYPPPFPPVPVVPLLQTQTARANRLPQQAEAQVVLPWTA